MTETDNNIGTLIRDLTRDGEKPTIIEDATTGLKLVKLREETGEEKLVDLEQYEHRTAPRRMTGTVTVHDVNSFTNYYNDYKLADSRVYFDKDASPAPGRFVGHINHPSKDAPAHTDYQVLYPLRYSDEWKLWTGSNGKGVPQAEFGAFLEDNMDDLKDPPAKLLDAAFNFSTIKTTKISQATRLRDGTMSFEFLEEMKDQGSVKLPETFKLEIPVFFRDKLWEIECRIRYVLTDDAKLKLRYEMIRPERILEAAVADTVQAINTLADTTVLYGKRN